MSTAQFYDDLTDYYDLIYADWEKSMVRQGRAIAEMLDRMFPAAEKRSLRVLDVSAGIGTQALPLAEMGYQVTARDLSPGAIRRLSREASARRLKIDAAPCDMRSISGSVEGPFDVIISFDNCIPHLQNDEEIADSLGQFRQILNPGGSLLLSVRDYDRVERTSESFHPHGERRRGRKRFRVQQHWVWLDSSHYRTTFLIEELCGGDWIEIAQTSATYYAISISRLLELMVERGYLDCGLSDVPFFQPVLTGRSAANQGAAERSRE
jgi:SAM-dependent methyltransferase